MFKRVTWFVSGLAAGAAGAGYAKKRVKAKAEQLRPVNVAKSAVNRVRFAGRGVADAVREGRTAMREKEAELTALRDRDGVRGGRLATDGAIEVIDVDYVSDKRRADRGAAHRQAQRQRTIRHRR